MKLRDLHVCMRTCVGVLCL